MDSRNIRECSNKDMSYYFKLVCDTVLLGDYVKLEYTLSRLQTYKAHIVPQVSHGVIARAPAATGLKWKRRRQAPPGGAPSPCRAGSSTRSQR